MKIRDMTVIFGLASAFGFILLLLMSYGSSLISGKNTFTVNMNSIGEGWFEFAWLCVVLVLLGYLVFSDRLSQVVREPRPRHIHRYRRPRTRSENGLDLRNPIASVHDAAFRAGLNEHDIPRIEKPRFSHHLQRE